ncbi:MAG: hypothetical protein WC791_01210 [Candidatus Paceibacterota bacterium]|jgi:ATP-dependent protease ClpP protease subunit
MKEPKRMKELFPAKNPAKVRLYGEFNDELEESFHKQLKASSAKEEPDGLMLLIDSQGGKHEFFGVSSTHFRG